MAFLLFTFHILVWLREWFTKFSHSRLIPFSFSSRGANGSTESPARWCFLTTFDLIPPFLTFSLPLFCYSLTRRLSWKVCSARFRGVLASVFCLISGSGLKLASFLARMENVPSLNLVLGYFVFVLLLRFVMRSSLVTVLLWRLFRNSRLFLTAANFVCGLYCAPKTISRDVKFEK